MAEPTTDIAVLQRLAGPRAGGDVVDVGCGPGRLARQLAAGGARVTGVEISEEQLADARAAEPEPERDDGHPRGTVSYAVGRAEALPLPDGSQDLAVFLRSLHHVPIEAMGVALDEARRVLRPGGAVYVAEPLAEGDFFGMVALIEDEREVRDAARATLDGAAAHGLQPVAAERYEIAGRYADLDAFARHMATVDPRREPLLRARRSELERAFARGVPGGDGGRVFRQAVRVDVLAPAPAG